MKTIIYTNNQNKKGKISELILGTIMIILAFTGLFFDSKLILKLVVYIIPFIILLYTIKPYKIALYFLRKNIKRFIIFLIQAIILDVSAIYILFFPIESLNYIIIVVGILLIINNINNMMLTNSKPISFISFLFGIICILFSNQIINTFYTIFLIFILFTGIYKVTTYIYLKKNRT